MVQYLVNIVKNSGFPLIYKGSGVGIWTTVRIFVTDLRRRPKSWLPYRPKTMQC